MGSDPAIRFLLLVHGKSAAEKNWRLADLSRDVLAMMGVTVQRLANGDVRWRLMRTDSQQGALDGK